MECLHFQTELSTTKIILQSFEKVEMLVWCCTVMCYMGAQVELVHGNEIDEGSIMVSTRAGTLICCVL